MARLRPASRIIDRRDNVIAVDFRGPGDPHAPEPKFPGAAGAREPPGEAGSPDDIAEEPRACLPAQITILPMMTPSLPRRSSMEETCSPVRSRWVESRISPGISRGIC